MPKGGPSGSSDVEEGRRNQWLCVVINQFAFPGLGTIISGSRTGYLQAAIMVAGFVLVMWFLLALIAGAVRVLTYPELAEEDFAAFYRPHAWAWQVGLPLCALACLWALFSSIAILRANRQAP